MTTFDSVQAIEILKQKCEADSEFTQLLTESFHRAHSNAKQILAADNLDCLFWPRNINDYLAYLNDFSHWAHRFCGQAAIQHPDKEQLQKAYTRLFHFYWLIDQNIGQEKNKVLQELPWFRNWLAEYEDLWEIFLNHADHLNNEILELLISDNPKTAVKQHKKSPERHWLPFNWQLNPLLTVEYPSDTALL